MVEGVDAGYFTAPVCHLAKEMSIALVPDYRRPNKGKNDYKKKHFQYDAQRDVYVCPAEEQLTYSTTPFEMVINITNQTVSNASAVNIVHPVPKIKKPKKPSLNMCGKKPKNGQMR